MIPSSTPSTEAGLRIYICQHDPPSRRRDRAMFLFSFIFSSSGCASLFPLVPVCFGFICIFGSAVLVAACDYVKTGESLARSSSCTGLVQYEPLSPTDHLAQSITIVSPNGYAAPTGCFTTTLRHSQSQVSSCTLPSFDVHILLLIQLRVMKHRLANASPRETLDDSKSKIVSSLMGTNYLCLY